MTQTFQDEVIGLLEEIKNDVYNMHREIRMLKASPKSIKNGNIDPDGVYQVYANPEDPIESNITVYNGIVTASSSPVMSWAVRKKKSWAEIKKWLEGKGGFTYKPI